MIEITKPLDHPLQTFEPQGAYAAEVWPSFDDFWAAYDYKKDKATARRRWDKLSQEDREAAFAYLEGYITNTYTDGRYPSRRHASVYLSKRTWEDELTIAEKPAAGIDRARRTAQDLADLYARKAAANEHSRGQ